MRAVTVLAFFSAALISTATAASISPNLARDERHNTHHRHHQVSRSTKHFKGLSWTGSTEHIEPFAKAGVTVVYNWQPVPPAGLSKYGLEGASQLWGEKSVTEFRKVRSEYKYLMGPNE
jgi:hypothetical protein